MLQTQLDVKYKNQFAILAFPIQDFHQEYDTNLEIQAFIKDHYPHTNFPIFSVSTMKDNVLYQQLQQQLPTQQVRHNFYKYLVGPDGIAVQLYPKSQSPLSLLEDIEQLLLQQPQDLTATITTQDVRSEQ
jgi:glutathione peroxidase-family protein